MQSQSLVNSFVIILSSKTENDRKIKIPGKVEIVKSWYLGTFYIVLKYFIDLKSIF